METNSSKWEKIKIGLGIFFILVGVTFNVWFIAKLLTKDGLIDYFLVEIIIWMFDIVSIALGCSLIIFRKTIQLKDLALSGSSLVILFLKT